MSSDDHREFVDFGAASFADLTLTNNALITSNLEDYSNAWGNVSVEAEDAFDRGERLARLSSSDTVIPNASILTSTGAIATSRESRDDYIGNHLLPYEIESGPISTKLLEYLDKNDPLMDTAEQITLSEETVLPLAIDSTRVTWDRLTTVKSKKPNFVGSRLQGEIQSILRSWIKKTRDQPSWNRPRSMHKKNRESIGPALFGWGRTDIPAWVASPSAQQASLTTPERFQEDLHDGADENDIDEFGHFESAPVVDNAVLDQPLTALSSPSVSGQSAHSQRGVTMQTVAMNDAGDTVLIKSADVSAESSPARRTEEKLPVQQTNGLDLLSLDSGEAGKQSDEQQPHTIDAPSDPWDLSIFERSLQATHVQESQPPTATPVNLTNRSRSDTRTRKEIEDQATVVRITSYLPDIEYLLP